MNAPYGVMRWTVPSTTAPISMSAMSIAPFGQGPSDPPNGEATIPPASKSVNTSAARGLGPRLVGDHEPDLPGLDHAQALPGQTLEVLGVVEPVDVVLEQGPPAQPEPRGPHGAAAQDPNLRYGSRPAYLALSPSSSSIRRRRLYLAVRSPRDGAPDLSWPAPVTTSRVSVSVPIWLGFTRMALAARSAIPRASRSGFVTNRSSPTIWHDRPRTSVAMVQPSQSSSASGSSIETIGNVERRSSKKATMPRASRSVRSR